jgi:hypothetical protein
MAQRDDQLARAGTGWGERLWGSITKVTLGYGYKPWRALLFLAAVVAVSCVLAVTLGSHGALAQTSMTATPGRSCTVVQKVSVGLDLNLPVGTSVARAACDLTKDSASVTAAWLTAAGWVCGYWRGRSQRCSSLASRAPYARHDLLAVAVLIVRAIAEYAKKGEDCAGSLSVRSTRRTWSDSSATT